MRHIPHFDERTGMQKKKQRGKNDEEKPAQDQVTRGERRKTLNPLEMWTETILKVRKFPYINKYMQIHKTYLTKGFSNAVCLCMGVFSFAHTATVDVFVILVFAAKVKYTRTQNYWKFPCNSIWYGFQQYSLARPWINFTKYTKKYTNVRFVLGLWDGRMATGWMGQHCFVFCFSRVSFSIVQWAQTIWQLCCALQIMEGVSARERQKEL